MDNNKIITTYNEAVIDTFEEMTFTEVVINGNNESKYEECFEVKIQKPFVLYIYYAFPKTLVNTLYENLYCEDEKNSNKDNKYDCVIELINTITGCFFKKYYKNEINFYFTFPEKIMEITGKKFDNKTLFDAEGDIFQINYKFGE